MSTITEEEARTLRTMLAEWSAARAQNAVREAKAVAAAGAAAASRDAMHQTGYEMMKYGFLGLCTIRVSAWAYHHFIGRYPPPQPIEPAVMSLTLVSAGLLFVGLICSSEW